MDSKLVIDMDSVEKVVVDPEHLANFSRSYTGTVYKLKSTEPPLISEPTNVKMVRPSSMRVQLKQALQKQQHEQQQMRLASSLPKRVTVVKVPTTPVSAAPKFEASFASIHSKHQQDSQQGSRNSQNIANDEPAQLYLGTAFNKPSVAQSLPVRPASSLPSPAAMSSSVPLDELDSPLSVEINSVTDSISELDEILGDIGLDSVSSSCFSTELGMKDVNLQQIAATLPEPAAEVFEAGALPAGSCPAAFIKDEPDSKDWTRERLKKDNHNIIERRRRYNINDRITELGTMLPKTHELEHRQNKGTILKASVDYIRHLKRDQEKLRTTETRNKELENVNRRMLLRIQELEMMMTQNGIKPTPSDSDSSKLLACVLGADPAAGVTLTPASSSCASSLSSHQQQTPEAWTQEIEPALDAMMEDSPFSALTDPMLSATPPEIGNTVANPFDVNQLFS